MELPPYAGAGDTEYNLMLFCLGCLGWGFSDIVKVVLGFDWFYWFWGFGFKEPEKISCWLFGEIPILWFRGVLSQMLNGLGWLGFWV